jgi:hypothetical protein
MRSTRADTDRSASGTLGNDADDEVVAEVVAEVEVEAAAAKAAM